MIEIPVDRLSAEVLNAVIEEFILREGTDYGVQEAGMDNKIAQVHRQLTKGDVLITFDPATENCTLLTKNQFRRYISEQNAENSEEKNETKSAGTAERLSSKSRASASASASAYEDYSQDPGSNFD